MCAKRIYWPISLHAQLHFVAVAADIVIAGAGAGAGACVCEL